MAALSKRQNWVRNLLVGLVFPLVAVCVSVWFRIEGMHPSITPIWYFLGPSAFLTLSGGVVLGVVGIAACILLCAPATILESRITFLPLFIGICLWMFSGLMVAGIPV